MKMQYFYLWVERPIWLPVPERPLYDVELSFIEGVIGALVARTIHT